MISWAGNGVLAKWCAVCDYLFDIGFQWVRTDTHKRVCWWSDCNHSFQCDMARDVHKEMGYLTTKPEQDERALSMLIIDTKVRKIIWEQPLWQWKWNFKKKWVGHRFGPNPWPSNPTFEGTEPPRNPTPRPTHSTLPYLSVDFISVIPSLPFRSLCSFSLRSWKAGRIWSRNKLSSWWENRYTNVCCGQPSWALHHCTRLATGTLSAVRW